MGLEGLFFYRGGLAVHQRSHCHRCLAAAVSRRNAKMSMSIGKSMAGPEQKGLNGGVRRFERQSDFVVALAFYFAKIEGNALTASEAA